MNFVFITPWYATAAGGLEIELKRYAECLAQLGHNVEVLTTCCENPYATWDYDYYPTGTETLNGVLVRRFKTSKVKPPPPPDRKKYQDESLWHIDTHYYRFRYHHGSLSEDLLDYIATYNDETILICGPYVQSLSYLALTRYPNKIYLCSAFHAEPQTQWHPVKDIITNAKGILFATEQEKAIAIQHHGKDMGRKLIEQPVIGVPVLLPNLSGDFSDIKQKHNLPDQYYVYVGRKDPSKGIQQLVTWYQEYITQNKDSLSDIPPLVFVGGGEKTLIPRHDKIIDVGYVSELTKNQIIKSALGLINLSPNESFSFVIMEAWLCGTPVIVPKVCTVTAHHCFNSQGGLVIHDSDSFCEALNQLKNPTLRTTLANNGREYVLNHYTIGTVVNNFLDRVAT